MTQYNCYYCGKEAMFSKCAPEIYPDILLEGVDDVCNDCYHAGKIPEGMKSERMDTADGTYLGLQAAKDLGIYTDELRTRAEQLLKEYLTQSLHNRTQHHEKTVKSCQDEYKGYFCGKNQDHVGYHESCGGKRWKRGEMHPLRHPLDME